MAEYLKPQKISAYGYQKENRLLKRPDFLSLSHGGRKCLKKHFLCFFRKGRTEKSRLGITVTKKIGCAVERNRIKRLCREYYRVHKVELRGIWDISIIARKSVAAASREQALKSLNDIFHVIAENKPSGNLR